MGVSLWKLQVISIGIGNGIFNTFETLKSIEVLGIQYNFVRVMVLSIQYFEMSIGSYPDGGKFGPLFSDFCATSVMA